MSATPTPRVAGAPISWGVCEVPGWGHQMPADRVLAEMAEVGLEATEAGPEGFLPAEPAGLREALRRYGLALVGGFVPLVLHQSDDRRWRDQLAATAAAFGEAGGDVVVLAAATGLEGYDEAGELGDPQWRSLLSALDASIEIAGEQGVDAVLHPHVGTVVEREHHVERVLDGSVVRLCLDTGHLLAGGADPVALARSAADRIGHVHFKDVDAGLAGAVATGTTAYSDAVRAAMYRPLGAGDVDVPAIVQALVEAGYDGWYVLEQDLMLDTEPAPGEGPVHDVAASLAYLRRIIDAGRHRLDPPG